MNLKIFYFQSNIFFDDEDKLKISDICEVRLIEAKVKSDNPYMSPEMIRYLQSNDRNDNEISFKTDIW